MKKFLRLYTPSIILSLIIIFFWQLYSQNHSGSELFLPAPSAIFSSFIHSRDSIFVHTQQTMLETLIGLGLATLFAVTIAISTSLSDFLYRLLYPFFIISQTIPMIALAPLLLLWFGFDLFPKVIVVILYCFFPIVISCTQALRYVDNDLISLLKSMNASKWQTMRIVRLPLMMPAFFSGLKIAAAYSVTGAIVGEFVGAYQGLGIFMVTSANSHAFSLVFVSVAIVALLSIFLVSLVSIAEWIIIPWHRQDSS